MNDPIEHLPIHDPLGRDLNATFATDIPVLGIDVRFASNAPRIIEIVEDAFGAWRTMTGDAELRPVERVRVTIVIHPGGEGGSTRPAVRYRMPDSSRVLLFTPGSAGIADAARREATAWVSADLVADEQHFRYGVLEALTLAVLTQLDRQPLHTAALARGAAALLLAGPSGTGKSTIAYAALRLPGVRLLAEDVVYVQSVPVPRIWGLPGFLHLPHDARTHFPELADRSAELLASGKSKIALRVKDLDALPERPAARRVGICLLSRSGDSARVEPIGAEELMAGLFAGAEEGFDVFAGSIEAAVRPFTDGGGWRLERGSDPHAAARLVAELLDRVAAHG